METLELGRALLTIARSSIGRELGLAELPEPELAALDRPSATFVTLRHAGELRGCIGSLTAERALRVDVRENAVAAAFRDPRFAPLAMDEFDSTSLQISLLSPLEPIHAQSERQLLAGLRPGIDGLVLESGPERTTLLPQVWEVLPDPREFVGALKRKAGLPREAWGPGLRFSRYCVTKWNGTLC